MDLKLSDNNINENYPGFNEIWNHRPELQNWSSSSWWFFLLLPKQKTGYGPKQMMFTYASRVGKEISVNKVWQKGMHLNRKREPDEFMTTVVGWINDGQHVHEEIVHQPSLARLSQNQWLEAWDEEEKYGASIHASKEKELEINAKFEGKEGYARFKIWTDPKSEFSQPQITDIRAVDNKLGGTHLVAWRRINFSGEFKHPCGTEQLEGIGYFQRVCMNVPMFPWKWLWVAFEDGNVFSMFIPYFGSHIFRRNDNFYNPILERTKFNLMPTSYFYDYTNEKEYVFSKIDILPIGKNGKIDRYKPQFTVYAENDKGDYIKFIINAHGHAQFLLNRRVIKRLWETKFNYNEFMVKVEKLQGKLGDLQLPYKNMGEGWGNLEYTWGLSI
ncbi:MAG: hypothetical protein OEY49_03870 [Candidatus Heimdallarchaeota archaeon]|nr:hypothetical protein [Candidatus Heimdallarchaeota archaeon]